jgi:hypothetical protein
MRGFRALGKVELVSMSDFDEGDLLFFSPHEDGGSWRSERGFRARDFDLFMCQTAVVTGACPSDYVFVATAIGEAAFTREPAPEDVS